MEEGRDEKGRFTEKNLWSVMKKRVGQPKKAKSPEILSFKALEYFEWCLETKNKVTFAGLRLWVDFSRENWSAYKKYPEFSDTMNHIELLLEAEWEARLTWAGSTQGAIFWLKNKAQWTDESTQHQNQTVTQVNIVEKKREE